MPSRPCLSAALGGSATLALLLSLVLSLGIAGCGSDSSEPFKECVRDEDCPEGSYCRYQECRPVQGGDPDAAESEPEREIPEIIEEEEIETTDLDPDRPINEFDFNDQPDSPDQPSDGEESGESADGDSVLCTPDTLDEECTYFSQLACRGNTVEKDVRICHEDKLYQCLRTLSCDYPTCGYLVQERYLSTCPLGCVSNPDPQSDDYCQGDEPDGDAETDGPGDTDAGGEETEEEETDLPTHDDGSPCSTSADCRPNHPCLLDFDEAGRYCAPSTDYCVYHVGLPANEKADFYPHGTRLCGEMGYRRCSSGQWTAEILCPADQCVNGYQFWGGQTCQDDAGCVPTPRPVPVDCAGNYGCNGEGTACRATCGADSDCRQGFVCQETHCNKRCLSDGECPSSHHCVDTYCVPK